MNRTFITGSEWLYYKIYTGPKTADLILTEVIKPVSEKLLENNIIDSWFFLRFADPKFHLRVRFHHPGIDRLQKTIRLIHDALMPYIETNLIWNVSNDTYNRELERYGYSLIEKAEKLFFYESVMIVGILAQIEGEDGETVRWLMGLRAIDDTLGMFGYDDAEKLSFVEKQRDTYGSEFGMNRELKLQLSNKYRAHKLEIEKVLNPALTGHGEMESLFGLLDKRNRFALPIAKELLKLEQEGLLEVPKHQLLNSYLHMMVNRLFKSKQRLHELVLYDYLCQYYNSQAARKRKGTSAGCITYLQTN